MIVLVTTARGRIPRTSRIRLERHLVCQGHHLSSMVHPLLKEVPGHPLAVGVLDQHLLGVPQLSRQPLLLLLQRVVPQLVHRRGNPGLVLSTLGHILPAARLILPLSQRPKEHVNNKSLLKANKSNSVVHRKNWRRQDSSRLQVDRLRKRNCRGSLTIMRGYGLD